MTDKIRQPPPGKIVRKFPGSHPDPSPKQMMVNNKKNAYMIGKKCFPGMTQQNKSLFTTKG